MVEVEAMVMGASCGGNMIRNPGDVVLDEPGATHIHTYQHRYSTQVS